MAGQNPNEFDELDQAFSRLFTRAAAQISPRRDLTASIQQRLAQGGSARMVWLPRLPAIAASVAIFLVVALLAGALVTLRGGQLPGLGGPVLPKATHTPAPTATLAPLHVTSVALAVSPESIAGTTCGASATFTYTATFTMPANTAGGTIDFDYTLNNGRSQTPGTLTVAPGATSATYTFTSSGALPSDHTYPGPALVMVTSPNQVISSAVTPTGACAAPTATATTPPPTGAFQVQSVAMAVSPASIAGDACGTNVTVVYTATFHLAANGPGGTIHYEYTVNNGRGSNLATLSVAPGQTSATATFQWSGALPPDHTMPEGGGVVVDSPNSLTSQLVAPSGRCS